MNVKKSLSLLLIACMLTGCGAPAGNDPETTATTTADATTEATTVATTEPTEPDDGRIKMYYDDRMTIAQLTGSDSSDVQITSEEITSTIPGTQDSDSAVLIYDQPQNRLIAVGTGTATVTVDGQDYLIRVRPAPISLVMITGHSIGAGQCGSPAQSALCPEGQLYSSTLNDEISFATPGMGLGYASQTKPNGIDALTVNGNGVQGEAAGLALQWNRLTGEKLWILNAAVGGSCLNEWVFGSTNHSNASALFLKAQFLLTNEITAGHYRLKNMAIIYHSAANFSYKNVSYTNQTLEAWYDSMWDGFKTGLAMDMDSDGITEAPEAIGFVPLPGGYTLDRPANYYMAASIAYPDMFMASLAPANWRSVQGIASHFPQIDYETHGEAVTQPLLPTDLKASDNVHYSQVAYNALGQDIANNLYAYLRQEPQLQSVTVLTDYGIEIGDTMKISRLGVETPLILLCEPYTVSDLTIAVSDNLTLNYPFVITATETGTGTITISQGKTVLKTITVTIG